MKSNSPEVRSLVQVLANKISLVEVELEAKDIGSALYGEFHDNSFRSNKFDSYFNRFH